MHARVACGRARLPPCTRAMHLHVQPCTRSIPSDGWQAARVPLAHPCCPACGAANRVRVDLFRHGRLDSHGLLQEVHSLAISYHWSESEILSLSRERRQAYLGLIDRARGVLSEQREELLP